MKAAMKRYFPHESDHYEIMDHEELVTILD